MSQPDTDQPDDWVVVSGLEGLKQWREDAMGPGGGAPSQALQKTPLHEHSTAPHRPPAVPLGERVTHTVHAIAPVFMLKPDPVLTLDAS